MHGPANRNAIIQRLAKRLREAEQAKRQGGGPGGSRSNGVYSTGAEPLDALLPDRGVLDGTLVEWLRADEGDDVAGSGAATLAFRAAARAMRAVEGACVVVDARRMLYPPALHPLGVPLNRMFVVHPKDQRDAHWAMEQSLRCPGVRVVVGWIDRIDGRDYRRLQLAAESGGGIGFIFRSAQYRAEPSWAAARLLVQSLPCMVVSQQSARGNRAANAYEIREVSRRSARRLRVELVHCRGRLNRGAVELELCDETGDVRLAPQLAGSENPPRAARA